ncbi:hypothetical protein [Paraburkholderia sp. BCC1876]|uniref:hypothetical protein n=1 Tax=Paraburkholderia sp. BCC1876 TaxID=2676303 RepID=UPI00159018C3|nr:hypothetical protein [Paraburkholderia sp. BCC1876]
MHTLLRSSFYSFLIVLLAALYYMNPETTQLRDVLLLLHSGRFWTAVETVMLILVALQMATGSTAGTVMDTLMYRGSRRSTRR